MIGYHKVFNLDDGAAKEFWSTAKEIAGAGFVKIFAVCLGGDQKVQDNARKVLDEVAGRAHGESLWESVIYSYAGVGALIDATVDGKQVSIPYVGHWTPPRWKMEYLESVENVTDGDKSTKPGIDIIVRALLKRCEIEISAEANWVAVVERGRCGGASAVFQQYYYYLKFWKFFVCNDFIKIGASADFSGYIDV